MTPTHGDGRRKLPATRQSVTHKFRVGNYEGYLTCGMYEDGTLGEFFLTDIGKEGSLMQGLMSAFATTFSIALQYGVPLEILVRKFLWVRFEPGPTNDPNIPKAASVVDYIARWLGLRFGDEDLQTEIREMKLDTSVFFR